MRAKTCPMTLLAAAWVAGTLAPAPARGANKDTELILAELRQLQAQVSQIQRAQGDLERMLAQLTARAEREDSSLRQSLVGAQTSLEDIKESLSIVSSRLDETNERIGNLGREVASLRQTQQPVLVTPEGLATATGAPSAGASGTPETAPETPTVAAVAPGPVELYNQAYTDYTQMRYPLAVTGFEEVIQRYPASDLADNAQYWIGECYLAQQQFEEALQAFETVLKTYPESNKLPEASYKRATALEGLGRREEAIEQLELIIEQFPRTQVERNARQRLTKLRSIQP